MSDLRKAVLKVAKANPELGRHLLAMLRSARKTSPTQEGAKKLYDKYKEQHPKTRLTERDFFTAPAKDEVPKGPKKGPAKGKPKGEGKKDDEARAKLLAERERKRELPNDLEKYGLRADPKDLAPEHREEIKEYNLDVVGQDAAQAIEVARKIREGIPKSADVCKMSPPVCEGNMGLTRDKMPQIEGGQSVKEMLATDEERTSGATFEHPESKKEVKFDELPKATQDKYKAKWEEDRRKGQAMVEAGADPNESRTVMQQMLDYLDSNGVRTIEQQIPVGELRATQKEIQAQKTFGMADAHLRGKFNDIDASVVISRDGHILDGHHRWAALLTIDPSRKMNVKVIDMDMRDLLQESQAVPGVYRADIRGEPLGKKEQEEYKASSQSTFTSKKPKGKSKKGPAKAKKPAKKPSKKTAMRSTSSILKLAKANPDFARLLSSALVQQELTPTRIASPRHLYLPPQMRGVPPLKPPGTDLEIWSWKDEQGRSLAVAYAGKQNKPLWYNSFRDDAKLVTFIQKTIDERKRHLEFKRQKAEERKQFQHGFQVGDILYSSWGYDQTQVDFYQVTQVLGKSIVLREIGSKVVKDEGSAIYLSAVPNSFIGPPMKKIPNQYGGVKINSSQSASKWDGKPKYQTGANYGR